MALVEFKADIYPHVKGDVVNVDVKELKQVDEIAKLRNISTPYVKVEPKKEADK